MIRIRLYWYSKKHTTKFYSPTVRIQKRAKRLNIKTLACARQNITKYYQVINVRVGHQFCQSWGYNGVFEVEYPVLTIKFYTNALIQKNIDFACSLLLCSFGGDVV